MSRTKYEWEAALGGMDRGRRSKEMHHSYLMAFPQIWTGRERRIKGKRGQRGGTGKNCRGGGEEAKYTHGLPCPVMTLMRVRDRWKKMWKNMQEFSEFSEELHKHHNFSQNAVFSVILLGTKGALLPLPNLLPDPLRFADFCNRKIKCSVT